MGMNKSSLKEQPRIACDSFGCFDDLSNELVLELFDYFSFYEINLVFG
jgi:hypothetical protein